MGSEKFFEDCVEDEKEVAPEKEVFVECKEGPAPAPTTGNRPVQGGEARSPTRKRLKTQAASRSGAFGGPRKTAVALAGASMAITGGGEPERLLEAATKVARLLDKLDPCVGPTATGGGDYGIDTSPLREFYEKLGSTPALDQCDRQHGSG